MAKAVVAPQRGVGGFWQLCSLWEAPEPSEFPGIRRVLGENRSWRELGDEEQARTMSWRAVQSRGWACGARVESEELSRPEPEVLGLVRRGGTCLWVCVAGDSSGK